MPAPPATMRYMPSDLEGLTVGENGVIPYQYPALLQQMLRGIYSLQDRVEALEGNLATSQGITVSAAGIAFIDVFLTANHTVSVPTVDDDTIVIWTFEQDATGTWTVTWPSTEFPTPPRIGTTALRKSMAILRKVPGPRFELIWAGLQDVTI